jgi:site-specific DNA recombinase
VTGETAKQAGRAQFGAMLAFLQTSPSCRTVLVEKTDRLYRNLKDWVTVDGLDLIVHFVREAAVVSQASGSSDKFMHGIKVLMAKNYVDNLSEEVRKGLREKAAQGHYPGVAPVGYVNNRVTHRIETDPVRGRLVTQLFSAYASGGYSLKTLTLYAHTLGLRHHRRDRRLVTAEIHRLLRNPIYTGDFRWLGARHRGSHTPLVTHEIFDQVQRQLGGSKRPRRGRQHAFMAC